jgi:hypothetical protein
MRRSIAIMDRTTAIMRRPTAIMDRPTAIMDRATAIMRRATAIMDRPKAVMARFSAIWGLPTVFCEPRLPRRGKMLVLMARGPSSTCGSGGGQADADHAFG